MELSVIRFPTLALPRSGGKVADFRTLSLAAPLAALDPTRFDQPVDGAARGSARGMVPARSRSA